MFAISAIALAVIVIADLLRPVPPEDRLRLLREELTGLRAAADSCRLALDDEEARLRASDARLDSLKRRIDFFENLDPRGVPADSYDIYIRAFNAYNSRIPRRTAAGDSLQAHWEACRNLIEQHNLIADSALALARELGLVRDSIPPGPSGSAADERSGPPLSAPRDRSPGSS